MDPDELKSYLMTNLPPLKVPKEFIAVDALPKSRAGKILRRERKRKAIRDHTDTRSDFKM